MPFQTCTVTLNDPATPPYNKQLDACQDHHTTRNLDARLTKVEEELAQNIRDLAENSHSLAERLTRLEQLHEQSRYIQLRYEIPKALSKKFDHKVIECDPHIEKLVDVLKHRFDALGHLLSPSSLVLNLFTAGRIGIGPSHFLPQQVRQHLTPENVTLVLVEVIGASGTMIWMQKQGSHFWDEVAIAFEGGSGSSWTNLELAVWLKVQSLLNGCDRHAHVHSEPNREDMEAYLTEEKHKGLSGELESRLREGANEEWSLGV